MRKGNHSSKVNTLLGKLVSLTVLCLFVLAFSHAQTVTLPIDFEGGTVVTSDFTNFDGGTGIVTSNPSPTGSNTSATVGRIVRQGGQVWAGAYLTTATNLNLTTNPYICMQVYTTAPASTRVTLKLEGCGGPCFFEIDAYTSVSGAWETICFDFSGQPANFDRLVFLFALGSYGNGTSNSTFYFDDIEQRSTLPLTLTPGSQVFCPSTAITLTYPGSGTYNWYDDLLSTNLLQASSASFTTGVLTGDTSFFVQNIDPVPYGPTPFGPSVPGNSYIGNSLTTSTFFTSNLDNGYFYSVDIILHIPTGPVPGNTCTYKVDIFNITQGTSLTLTRNLVGPVNFDNETFSFIPPLPIFLNDQLEMRVTSLTGHPCYCTSTGAGNSGSFVPFPSSIQPQVIFTGHTSGGVSNQIMSGLNYTMSGDFVDPTLFQVNAIEDCSNPLPVELLDFSVQEDDGEALLKWTTGSEINNSHFKVMRTVDGNEFELLGTVEGSGNSSTAINYRFRDTNPLEGLSYYRLTQVDYDGTESFSWLVAFDSRDSFEIGLYPNPTSQELNVSLGSSYEFVEAKVLDVYGRQVFQREYASVESLKLDLVGSAGNYLVVILVNGVQKAVFNVVKTQ